MGMGFSYCSAQMSKDDAELYGKGNFAIGSYRFYISHRYDIEILNFTYFNVSHVWKVPNCQLPKGLQDQLCKAD